MSDLKMNKEDGVESYEFATPEAIEEALKIGKLSQTVFGMGSPLGRKFLRARVC